MVRILYGAPISSQAQHHHRQGWQESQRDHRGAQYPEKHDRADPAVQLGSRTRQEYQRGQAADGGERGHGNRPQARGHRVAHGLQDLGRGLAGAAQVDLHVGRVEREFEVPLLGIETPERI